MHTPGTEERSGGQDAEHGLQDSWLVDWIDRTCYDFAEDDCVSRPKTRVLTATVVRCPFVLHALFEAAAREKWNVSAARALASMPVCTRDRQAPMHRSDPRVTLPSATIYIVGTPWPSRRVRTCAHSIVLGTWEAQKARAESAPWPCRARAHTPPRVPMARAAPGTRREAR